MALFAPFSVNCLGRTEEKVPTQNEDRDFVIVARLIKGSKFRWDRIEVLKVLKAPRGITLPRELEVAVPYDVPPISTKPTEIRLIRYNENRRDLWKVASNP